MKLNDDKIGPFVTMRVKDPETGELYLIEWSSGGQFMRECASMMNRSILISWWLRLKPGEVANGTKAELIEKAGRVLDDAFEYGKQYGVKPK